MRKHLSCLRCGMGVGIQVRKGRRPVWSGKSSHPSERPSKRAFYCPCSGFRTAVLPSPLRALREPLRCGRISTDSGKVRATGSHCFRDCPLVAAIGNRIKVWKVRRRKLVNKTLV
jgi:hypothetical protein